MAVPEIDEDVFDETLEEDPDAQEADGDGSEGDEEGDDADGQEKDDEGDDDGQEGGADQVAAQPGKKGGRANDTIRRLRSENQEFKRRLDDLTRQTELVQRNTSQQRNFEAEEAERQRVALMSPEERMDYRLEQIRNENRIQQQQLQMQLAEQTDRANFEAKASVSPVYKQYAPLVEKRLKELQAQGTNVPRETLMRFIIGDKALEKAEAAKTRQAKKGQTQARQQMGRASNPRGQQQAEGRRQGKTAAERLEGIKF